MYQLYYSPSTASLAVHWMLIEMGAPFELALIHAVKFGGLSFAGVVLGVNLTLLALAAVIAPWRRPLARVETA